MGAPEKVQGTLGVKNGSGMGGLETMLSGVAVEFPHCNDRRLQLGDI